MRALFFDGQQQVHLEDIPIPSPAAGEVLVRVAFSGVCQTEFEAYTGQGSKNILGHEFSGEVVEIGAGVARHKSGDRVICHPFMPCGTCSICRTGRLNICRRRTGLARLYHGGFAEYIALPEANFLPLPDDIGMDTGVLVLDVLGMMWHGMKDMPITPASTIAVIGLQPYGLGAVCIGKMMGAAVIAFDASAFRREQAMQLGADHVIDSNDPARKQMIDDLTEGEGFEHIIECDDPAFPFEDMFTSIRAGGIVNLMGHAKRTFQMNPNWVTLWEVKVSGTPIYNPCEHDQVLQVVRRAAWARDIIVTHRPKLDEAKAALDAYVAGNAGKIAFVLNPV